MPLRAQVTEPQFGVPFDFPLLLSGNFGELRSNHFHGGLDFKTQGVVGKPLLAIADGYISKVTVTAGGYGNALYITHDNGYTSVHGHLDHFLPEIARRIRERQYQEQSFVVTLEFGPKEFRVRQGDVVAYAGNTGYSFGPHLHMEIRTTDTNEPIDPLPFYKDKIADHIAPRATHIMVYGAGNEGKVTFAGNSKEVKDVDGKIIFKARASEQESSSLELLQQAQPRLNHVNSQFSILNLLTAWGRISTAISANDYMDGTSNNYGVRYVRLYVDDRLVSSSDVDRFSFDENRLINSWTDYAEQRRSGRWYMCSPIAENNDLRMLSADEQRGWVTIDEERDYHFRYELEDLYGNKSTYRFVVRGKRMDLPQRLPNYYYRMDASRNSRFYTQGFELWMPQGTLFDDIELDYEVIPSDIDQSHHYRLTNAIVPLRRAAEITIPTHKEWHIDGSKLYVARVNGKRRTYCGGTYRYGRITANITELGTYTVCADTIAPKITPIGSTSWRSNRKVVLRIADGETGIRDYRGTIDGRWVLFKYSSKTAQLTCDLKAEGIKPSKLRVEVEVTDMRGNARTLTLDCEL
ncbi:MAG: M23 family metallopeptidase [Bacteroidaceae bacterium]|nr:M23 family metallopeptidase [Bacteroidaceae bacterium]